MPAPLPGLSRCVLFTLYIFQKEELNTPAFNWDTCSHLVLCLPLIPLLYASAPPLRNKTKNEFLQNVFSVFRRGVRFLATASRQHNASRTRDDRQKIAEPRFLVVSVARQNRASSRFRVAGLRRQDGVAARDVSKRRHP